MATTPGSNPPPGKPNPFGNPPPPQPATDPKKPAVKE